MTINVPRGNQLKAVVLGTVVVAACNPMRGCPESNFDLRAESRVPKWFSVPSGQSRHDVNLRLTYYSGGTNVDDAVMELVDQNGRSLATATGQMCWHPAMHSKTNGHGGFDPGSYPHYVIVTVKGATEVFEHARMEPFFGVTDDPVLVAQAKESVSKGECSKNP